MILNIALGLLSYRNFRETYPRLRSSLCTLSGLKLLQWTVRKRENNVYSLGHLLNRLKIYGYFAINITLGGHPEKFKEFLVFLKTGSICVITFQDTRQQYYFRGQLGKLRDLSFVFTFGSICLVTFFKTVDGKFCTLSAITIYRLIFTYICNWANDSHSTALNWNGTMRWFSTQTLSCCLYLF